MIASGIVTTVRADRRTAGVNTLPITVFAQSLDDPSQQDRIVDEGDWKRRVRHNGPRAPRQ